MSNLTVDTNDRKKPKTGLIIVLAAGLLLLACSCSALLLAITIFAEESEWVIVGVSASPFAIVGLGIAAYFMIRSILKRRAFKNTVASLFDNDISELKELLKNKMAIRNMAIALAAALKGKMDEEEAVALVTKVIELMAQEVVKKEND